MGQGDVTEITLITGQRVSVGAFFKLSLTRISQVLRDK
jgi:hypothetical protein